MKMIYESAIENSDFLELALTRDEYDLIIKKGVVQDYCPGIYNDYNLNIFIRLQSAQEEAIGEERMPFRSKAQRAYLAINEPEVAHEFAMHTTAEQSANLPKRVKKPPAKKARKEVRGKR